MNYCEVCGENNIEVHHIIFRSEASYLSNIKINFKYLCPRCHKGKNGPHCNYDVNLRFKRELRTTLQNIFNDKNYYTEKELKEILNISSSEVLRIFKSLRKYKEGYKKSDIILRLMGGNLYLNDYEMDILNLKQCLL